MTRRTYQNPVFDEYFADPFVWQHDGEYFAVGTGAAEAAGATASDDQAKVFPLLHSQDLLTWRRLGSALIRPDPALGDSFWAPEVAVNDSRFYLYYSVGFADTSHHLRVAVSDDPRGPYRDCGVALTDLRSCSFAIDPHAFRDVDGRWYLFPARDFLDTSSDDSGPVRAGTALVVHELSAMTSLAPSGKTVLRARCDWQRFLNPRTMYGQVFDWHTLEGPCVVRHDDRYYCFYSGGCWQGDSYGVDYGVADQVQGPYSDAGNDDGPRILRTVPGKVIGPGHNSIVLGPDGETLYIVYHAWDAELRARRMCIDKLEWTSDGPRCAGPTSTPQMLL
jgi:beta-xylosidase